MSGISEAVRVEPGSGAGLNGQWVMALADISSGGCTMDVEQVAVDLTGSLACQSFEINLEGTLDGNTLTLVGSIPPIFMAADLIVKTTVSEDGASAEGGWQHSPPRMTGSFAVSRQGGSIYESVKLSLFLSTLAALAVAVDVDSTKEARRPQFLMMRTAVES